VRAALAILALFAGLGAGFHAVAQPAPMPQFAWPVDCTLGDDCFIQKHVDRDPGPGASDFTCGSLTLNDHDGTDIALRSYAAMRTGVAVRAAAGGRVRAIREDVPDVSVRTAGAPDISDRECGNRVAVDHGGGWLTDYCHLKRGSIAVKPGDTVKTGDVLGQIGLSGQTEFPHVHFSIRRGREAIDPFDGRPAAQTCGQAAQPLWSLPVAYASSGIIRAGLAGEEPKQARIEDGDYVARTLPPDAPVLTFWITMFGQRTGDQQELTLSGPDGKTLARSAKPAPRTQIRVFQYVGVRRPAAGWTPGTYKGEYRLLREGKLIAQATREMVVPPR